MPQQRVPDPAAEVVVVQRLAFLVAEDVVTELAGGRMLRLQRLEDDLRHLDVALRAVGLGVLVLPQHEGLADEDQALVEVDVLPLQAVGLAGAHAGKEPHGEIVAPVGPHGGQHLLHLLQRERLDVGLPQPQRLEVDGGRHEAVAVSGLGQDLPHRRQDAVDAFVAQLGGSTARQIGELGAEGKDVGLGDAADRFVAEVRQQVAVQRALQDLQVGPAPLDLVLGQPGGGEVLERWGGTGGG